MANHTLIGLLSLLFAVLVGIAGAILSLLLLWPGLDQAGRLVRLTAQSHSLLLVFFAFIPATLNGLAMARLPGQVGARRTTVPALDSVAFGLTIAALVALIGRPVLPAAAALGTSAALLAAAVVLNSSTLIGTMLVGRTKNYSELPVSAWTTLIAATLAICTAPVMAASLLAGLRHSVALRPPFSAMIWPALCVVLVLVLGWATEIFRAAGRRQSAVPFILVGILGGEVLTLFLAWAFCLENRIGVVLPVGMIEGLSLLMVLPFAVLWVVQIVRAPRMLLEGRPPVMFATGFAVLLPVGLLADLLQVGGHEAVSLAVVFAILACFFQWVGQFGRKPIPVWAAQAQFWLLLGGSLALMLPVPGSLKAVGAAMSSVSIGLFVVHLLMALGRRSVAIKAAESDMILAVGRSGS